MSTVGVIALTVLTLTTHAVAWAHGRHAAAAYLDQRITQLRHELNQHLDQEDR